MSGKYNDIINLPHPVSKRYPRMPLAERAAQFSPFAALTGYESVISETARLTDKRVELDENRKSELDATLSALVGALPEKPEVTITFFKKDSRKEGGKYITLTACLKKIDATAHTIVLTDGVTIPIADIYALSTAAYGESYDRV